MFNNEIPLSPMVDPLSPRGRELLDRLDAHNKKVRAQQEANKLVRSLRNDHTQYTKLTLTSGNTLVIQLVDPHVKVVIQDQKFPFNTISWAHWDIQTKELQYYEEFDAQGLRAGYVLINTGRLINESKYRTIDDREKRQKRIDFDTGLQRKVYDQVATMFTLARNALVLEKTAHLLSR